jgi:hypothetical protein
MNTDLTALRDILFWMHQLRTWLHISWRLRVAWVGSLCEVAKVRLSAQPTTRKSKSKLSLRTSSIRTDHRKGDNIPPCGQPRLIVKLAEEQLWDWWANLFDRKDATSLTRYAGHPLRIREASTAGCHAASNTLLMSKKAHAVMRLWEIPASKNATSAWQAVSVHKSMLIGTKPASRRRVPLQPAENLQNLFEHLREIIYQTNGAKIG